MHEFVQSVSEITPILEIGVFNSIFRIVIVQNFKKQPAIFNKTKNYNSAGVSVRFTQRGN